MHICISLHIHVPYIECDYKSRPSWVNKFDYVKKKVFYMNVVFIQI